MVDRRALAPDLGVLFRVNNLGLQAGLWTALPGIVVSFDPALMTCSVQPAIMALQQSPDGSAQFVKLPVLVDCPVMFQGGGGFTLTFPVAAGDECLVVFASRCIDSWWNDGKVGVQSELRMHDLSDGFVLAGVRSRPHALPGVSAADVQLRSNDGTAHIGLDASKNVWAVTPGNIHADAGGTAEVTAPGGITLNGDVQVNGTLHTTGSITAPDINFPGARTFLNHRHDDVVAGTPGNPPMPGF